MAVWLDTGHGAGNRKPGIFDPGAVGNGAREADVVRALADATIPLLQARGVDVRRAPDGNIATVRVPWQKKTLTAADTFIALHMDSAASPTASGCTVFYPDDAPHLRTDAERFVTAFSQGTGIRSRGAKPDTSTAVGYVAVLHASDASAFLLEGGYMGNAADLAAVQAKGADALATAICTILDMSTFQPTETQRAAFALMLSLGVYTSGTPRSQERYEQAVLFARLLAATDKRYVRV